MTKKKEKGWDDIKVRTLFYTEADFVEWERRKKKTQPTPSGQPFTGVELCMLAYAVYKRFGYNKKAALAAWGRLMQTPDPDEEHFEGLCTFGLMLWNQGVGAAEGFMRKRDKK